MEETSSSNYDYLDMEQNVITALNDFRKFLLDIEHQQARIRRRLRDTRPLTISDRGTNKTLVLSSGRSEHDGGNVRYKAQTIATSTSNSTPTPTATASPSDDPSLTTATSTDLSGTNGSSYRPPSYKTALRALFNPLRSSENKKEHSQQQKQHQQQPTPPVRTKRRSLTLANTAHTRFSTSSSNDMSARGALIVLEGLDRVGKSTLAKKLVEHFERTKKPVTSCRFPDRTTPVGKVIDDVLKNASKKIDDHALHLLFSANRWEFNKSIRRAVESGTTVIVDRYSYSGIAYSSAKRSLTMDWCRGTERGLPKPDLVIYLELPKDAQYKRPGFGDERFESRELQELIRIQYEHIMEASRETWLKIDVENKSPDQVLAEVIVPVKRCLESCATKELECLEFF